MKNLWEQNKELCITVQEAHHRAGLWGGGGHSFDHALRVGQMAVRIAVDEPVGAMAGIAGLCHNADRILQKQHNLGRQDVSDDKVVELVSSWLRDTYLPPGGKEVVIAAVVNHSKPNEANEHPVSIALKDADRLVNMEPDLIMRAAQYYADLPTVDPVHRLADPHATFKAPRSVLRAISDTLDWVAESGPFVLRLPKARELGKKYAVFLRSYIDAVLALYQE